MLRFSDPNTPSPVSFFFGGGGRVGRSGGGVGWWGPEGVGGWGA